MEKRVAMTPQVLTKCRKLGFSIVMEKNAGLAAGFTDEDYIMKCRVKQTRKIAYFLKKTCIFPHDMEKRVTFDRSANESVLVLCILLILILVAC